MAAEQHAEHMPAPGDTRERRQQLDHAETRHHQREGRAAPGQERALVGEGEPGIGFGAVAS